MKPHPRTRKAIKWGGAAATLLLVAALIASGWFRLSRVSHRGWGIVLERGLLQVVVAPSIFTSDGHIRLERRRTYLDLVQPYELSWKFKVESHREFIHHTIVSIPLWSLALLTLLPAAPLWFIDIRQSLRARNAGRCPKCRYDRTGLPANAVCPECGTPPKSR
jgi:hypothetical protein